MLILNENDIEKLVAPKDVIDSVKQAMLTQMEGDFVMPNRMHVDYKQNTLLLMPSFIPDKFSTKLVSLFPENHKYNKPTITGLVVLNDGKTGEPLAVINGAKLTSIRTAAVSGVGFELFKNDNINSIGLIGTGVQGLQQLYFAISIIQPKEIWLYDSFVTDHNGFINQLKRKITCPDIKNAKSNSELVHNCQLIITATSSEIPVLPNDHSILKGKKIVSIGSYKPSMRELPDELFPLLDKYYVDTIHAIDETGDIIDPINRKVIRKDSIISMGNLLSNPRLRSTKKTELYKTVGMALFDLFVADLIYKKAKAGNIGVEVSI